MLMFVGRYRTGKRLGILLLSRCFLNISGDLYNGLGDAQAVPDFLQSLRKFPSMDHRYKFRRLFPSIISILIFVQ